MCKHWTTGFLVLLCLALLRSDFVWAFADSSSSRPNNQKAQSSQPSWLAADFDGDHISDLVVGGSGAFSFRVDIHLSSKPDETFVQHGGGIGTEGRLFAFDVDRDNDQDLIFVSSASPSRPAVWLNDGKGHFVPSQRTEAAPLLSENPVTWEEGDAQSEPVSVAQDDDCAPLDRCGVVEAARAVNVTAIHSPYRRSFVIETKACAFSPRSPPSSSSSFFSTEVTASRA